jgi:hypothetical protein
VVEHNKRKRVGAMSLSESGVSASWSALSSQLPPALAFTLQPRPTDSPQIALPKRLIRSVRTDMWLRACFETVVSGNRRFETPVPPIATNVSSSTFEIQARRLCRLWRAKAFFSAVMLDRGNTAWNLKLHEKSWEDCGATRKLRWGSSVYIVNFAPVY